MNTEETTTGAPLPYIYDETNEVIASIMEQVVNFCGYKLKGEEETEEGEPVVDPIELWPKIWQAIRYISSVTCWTDSDDDTFITQLRTQTYLAEQEWACKRNCCICDDDHIIIPLDYQPNPTDFWVGGTISVVVGGKVETAEITKEYLIDHYDPYTGKLYIIRDDFPDILLYKNKCCCLCRRKLRITLQYLAGYDTIPYGLLPLICPIIQRIDEAKIGMSSCHQATSQVAGLLKRKVSGNVEYEWSTVDTASQTTETMYTELFNIANLEEVIAISRCPIVDSSISMIGMGDVV